MFEMHECDWILAVIVVGGHLCMGSYLSGVWPCFSNQSHTHLAPKREGPVVPHSSSSLSVAQKEPALFLLSPGGELLSPHEECQVRKLWLHSHHLQQDKALSVLTEKKKNIIIYFPLWLRYTIPCFCFYPYSEDPWALSGKELKKKRVYQINTCYKSLPKYFKICFEAFVLKE